MKQKEGELANAQNMMSSLERSRAGLTQELASVSQRNEKLEQEVKAVPKLRDELRVSVTLCTLHVLYIMCV